LQTIEETINKYSMVNRNEESIIALSGGKDSLFVSFALRELGYKIRPVIIDMGYETNWGNKIVDLFSSYDLKPIVVDTRNTKLNSQLLPNLTSQINEGLAYLDKYVPDSQSTPCTVCYNTKIVSLSIYAKKEEISKIVFGHHGTDAITSFLKSAFMYIDRWDNGHNVFQKINFKSLVEKTKTHFESSFDEFILSDFCQRLQALTNERVISTDEPPVQNYVKDENIMIIRPLFNIFEDAILQFKATNTINTFGSGCNHSGSKDTHTPREIIQYDLLYEIFGKKDSFLIQTWLLDLLSKGLTAEGKLIVNARNERERILGKTYKNTTNCSIKF
jgi:tRNA(Ile)-lysidine synthase TilS/MesJ